MIDAHTALRAFLLEDSDLLTTLGGDYVFWPEVPGGPGGPAMPRKAISFRFTGGLTEDVLAAQEARASFRCWGGDYDEAMAVYRGLYDRLHGQQNFIVDDVGFHGAIEEVPGSPLEDPVTNWPYVFAVYSIRVATIPVTALGEGS